MARNEPTARLRKCPVTHHTTDQEDFEHDFTTPNGIPGSLNCPFANLQNGLPITPKSISDPVAAEFHTEKASTVSHTGTGTGSGVRFARCPIRFLDKHSPEEIAQYVENHKHEVPRSHEICVRRYQQSESQIRQLDSKYGNLVNMIQGLGNKHRAYLPKAEKVDGQVESESSTKAVQKWADNISHKSVECTTPEPVAGEVTQEDHDRQPRFQKPLREVRVGESPTRPWGIHVPTDKEPAPSAFGSENMSARSRSSLSVQNSPAKNVEPLKPVRSKQQDEHTATADSADVKPQAEVTSTSAAPVFNFYGPVFFGYSPEDTANLLKSLNMSSFTPKG